MPDPQQQDSSQTAQQSTYDPNSWFAQHSSQNQNQSPYDSSSWFAQHSSANAPKAATTAIIDKNGNPQWIPAENIHKELANGAKRGVVMTSPDGETKIVSTDQAGAYLKQGYKAGPANQQNLGPDTPQVSAFNRAATATLSPFYMGDPNDAQNSYYGSGPIKQVGSEVSQLVRHPIDTTGRVVKQSVMGVVQPMANTAQDAINSFKGGDYAGGSAQAVESMIPVFGAQANKAGKELSSGDVASGVGTMASMSIQGALASPEVMDSLVNAGKTAGGVVADAASTALQKVAPTAAKTGSIITKPFTSIGQKFGIVDPPPEDLITRAIKPGNKNQGWSDAVQNALPNIKAAETDLGHPIQGLDDAIDALNIAKKNVWQQYAQKLDPAKTMGATIDGNSIADAMMNSIDARKAAQDPALYDKISSVADTYRRPLDLGEAEDYLQSVNRELTSYYAKNKVGRRAAMDDPGMSYTVAEGDALRSSLYDKLDEVSGPGAADIKQQYGALSNIEAEMLNRRNVAARQQPNSLSEQLSTARGYGKIIKGVLTLDPGDIAEGVASKAASNWLKERNSTDSMITRAFSNVSPAKAPTIAPEAPIAGLLPKGPTITPAPADVSGSTPYDAPAYDATTRAQRKGLLLPEQTATPLPASSVLDASQGVLPAQKIIARDPATGQMKTFYGSGTGPTVYQGAPKPQPQVIEPEYLEDTDKQGGHAGGGVNSVEELARPGINYTVGKGGNIGYQGKAFDPGATPSGGVHVTVMPNGDYRINAGQDLSPMQKFALQRALKEGKGITLGSLLR
jgi:hypothetical protein